MDRDRVSIRLRRGPTGRIQVVGPHASTCLCYGCRQAKLARRIGVDLNPKTEPQGPPGWLVPLVGGGTIFWIGLFLLV